MTPEQTRTGVGQHVIDVPSPISMRGACTHGHIVAEGDGRVVVEFCDDWPAGSSISGVTTEVSAGNVTPGPCPLAAEVAR